ncbi:3-oxoadipate enol-lactonase [Corynebacterium cystitidis]|uniref:3-oxoadipate enol-lactonase n=1 Tax=Corynebacterium cystitidis DSM 20524 TaxID=1121357 RepID=A0A1H9SPS0_9CORY|nr:3-oxoadipate enol-lactonase [Corynebacterium cystitidis]WJY83131.1 3-oxoadipate enol-lactonase 2 [Corynebacterium cystitidis DSM 20524]SER87012.1 3-oxoadipate enol-lactonase [Corynebacterium cystitidis DSM 20524]SNV66604.1 3-oxoadipate enol-lactone hydrolase/4-carboxymuconolactone decarboxylase [Corynebacterium cystitidis]
MITLDHVELGNKNSSRTLVFLGSIASTTAMWAPQFKALADDYRIIAVNHRGHGDSPVADVTPGVTTMADLADDVLHTLNQLDVEEFAVIGLSLGGAIAQYLAAHCPQVTKAVFCCTAAYFGGPEKWVPRAELTRREGLDPMVDGVVGLWFTPDYADKNPSTVAEARDMILSTSGEGYAQCSDALSTWDFTDSLGKIACPVLTIAGDGDQSTPPQVVSAIAAGVSGSSTSVVVPGAHVPTLESPAEFTQALQAFL